MFMANGVVSHRPDHRRQITHFEMPDAIFFQDGSDFLHEGEWVLQIIEHRNRGNNSRPLLCETRSKKLGGEKIHQQRNIFSIKGRKLLGGGIDSSYRQAPPRT